MSSYITAHSAIVSSVFPNFPWQLDSLYRLHALHTEDPSDYATMLQLRCVLCLLRSWPGRRPLGWHISASPRLCLPDIPQDDAERADRKGRAN